MIQLKYSAGFIASAVFGFFTMILYLVLVKVLIQFRKVFNTTYYHFFLLSAILCIISYLDSWPVLILPNAVCKGCTFSDLFEVGTFPGLNVLRFIYAYINHTICYLEILMIFNRYTAIAFHFEYKAIWTRFSYYPLILVFIIPIALTYSSFGSTSYIYYKEQFDAYAIRSDESVTRRKLTAAGSMLIVTLSVCIFGGMTIYALYKHPVLSTRSIEVKLFIHALINALNGTFSFVYAVIFTVSNQHMTFQILTALFPAKFRGLNESTVMECILLLNTCFSPYILLICSKKIRDRMPIFSRFKNRVQSMNSSVNPVA